MACPGRRVRLATAAVSDLPSNWVRTAPGVPVIRNVNWGGLHTLYVKEVRRFFKVQLQTIWAPAVTTLLFLIIFTVALGRTGRMVMGVPFADFLAPGLIVMGMIQNAFANSSFSLLVGKIQGTIVDYLMPPLSVGELIAGLLGASITRAFLVGAAVWLAMLAWPGVHIVPRHLWAVLWFGLMGSMMLALRKRPVATDQIEEAVDRVIERLRSLGEREVSTNRVGDFVMRELAKLDKIAYIRFASVYRNFETPEDFREALQEVKAAKAKRRK